MLYYLYQVGLFLAKILPVEVGYVIAIVAARSFYFLSREERLALHENLRIVLGDSASQKEVNKKVRGVLINFGKYLADFFKFTKFTREYIEKNIEEEGLQHRDKCLSEGNGAIAITAHIGNWEMGGAIVGALGYPLHAIVLEHKDKRINDFFIHQRAINNMKGIPLGFGLRKCFATLKRNEILAIASDKDYTGDCEDVNFFGKKAALPRGAAALCIKTGAPIVPIFLIRKKDNSFKLYIEEPIRYTESGDYSKDLVDLMERCAKVFEKHISKHPDQWYAFEKVWKQEPITQ